MRSTAESVRDSSVEQCRTDAKEYLDGIQARKSDDIDAIRGQVEADVATIRARSQEQAERVRAETEDRIARRMELLQRELAESNAAIQGELERVEARVVSFQHEVTSFFDQILGGDDPTDFANLAAHMPIPPTFDPNLVGIEPEAERPYPAAAGGPRPSTNAAGANPTQSVAPPPPTAPAITNRPAAPVAAPAPTAPATVGPVAPPAPSAQVVPGAPIASPASAPSAASTRAPLLPGNLWGAGAVRGRLFSEWYPEVERLREIGEEDAAVALLLDIVFAAEAESRAEGSYVPPRAYAELADIYHGRGDIDGEHSILDRFARQDHATNAVTAQLMERLKVLKKTKR